MSTEIPAAVTNQEEQPPYVLESDGTYLGFEKVEVTEVDDTKPWKPPTKVSVTNKDGTVVENLDANTSFFTFRDAEQNKMTVSAAAAGHIDALHIKGTVPGSRFAYDSLEALFSDAAKKIPPETAKEPGVSAFSVEMEKHMGREGIASIQELVAEGTLSESDIGSIQSVKADVILLNREGSQEEKAAFVEHYRADHPDSRVQFQLVRDTVLVPIVDTPKRDTTELFMVFGPGADGKTLYTAAPGRNMPKHPDPKQHMDSQTNELNEATFNESAEAWFNTVMLTGKEEA